MDEEDERAGIAAVFETASAVRTRTVEILGMRGTTLWRKMKKYGLDEEARGLSE